MIASRNVNRTVVGLCLCAALSSVHAEHWVTAAKNDHETVYLDGDTIKRDEAGDIVVWTRHDMSAHPILVDNLSIAMSLERDAFDCSRGRVRSLSSIGYDHNGAVVSAIDVPSPYNEIPPGTVISSIGSIACGAAKRLGIR